MTRALLALTLAASTALTAPGFAEGVFQFGNGASADVDQVGTAEAGLLFQVAF